MDIMKYVSIGILFMLFTSLALFIPNYVTRNVTYNRSRWMLVTSLGLLIIHYFLQIVLDPREVSPSYAVAINLLFEVPVVALNCVAVVSLHRLRKGCDKALCLPGVVSVVITWALIGWAAITGGGLTRPSRHMFIAEVISCVIYMAVQLYYVILFIRTNLRLRRVLANYFDSDLRVLSSWAVTCIAILGVINIITPVILFCSDQVLAIYTFFIMFFIFYFIVSFICYGVAGAPEMVDAAQANALATKMEDLSAPDFATSSVRTFNEPLNTPNRIFVEESIERWTQRGGHLRSGITMETVAHEMGVPRDQLTLWLKNTPWELFSPWLAHLRIESAKQLLQQHPEWTIEAIAEQSGFKSRIYFQQAFKKSTHMTPAQYRSYKEG